MRDPVLDRTPVRVDALPNHCPICECKISPVQTPTYSVRGGRHFEVAYTCPDDSCRSIFIARYEVLMPSPTTVNGYHSLTEVVPKKLHSPHIEEEIETLSPNFVEIYSQAYQAETLGLGHIAGIGYRKSLEFLVKDYCISEHPDHKEQIKAKRLANCINEYIDDQRIKNCAQRASWLGNDEAHYVRKWSDNDVEDLKILIRLCQLWIQGNLLTKSYAENMKS